MSAYQHHAGEEENGDEESQRLLTNEHSSRFEEEKYPVNDTRQEEEKYPAHQQPTQTTTTNPTTSSDPTLPPPSPSPSLPLPLPLAAPVVRLSVLTRSAMGVENSAIVEATLEWRLEQVRDQTIPRDTIQQQTNTVIPIYMGKRLPPSSFSCTLRELGIRPNTCIHFIVQDRSVGGAGDGSGSHSSFQNDPQQSHQDEQYVQDMQYDGFYMLDQVEREGTMCEFVLGAMMGVMLGIISLIWLLQPSVTRLCRLGIFFGIGLNILLGMSRWFIISPGMSHIGSDGPPGARESMGTGFDPGAHKEPALIGPQHLD